MEDDNGGLFNVEFSSEDKVSIANCAEHIKIGSSAGIRIYVEPYLERLFNVHERCNFKKQEFWYMS
jgi:hypothetical protein